MRKIKRILLVDPPRTTPIENAKKTRPNSQPPLGLACLAAVLEKHGYEVQIVDAIIEDALSGTAGVPLGNGLLRYGLDDANIEKYIKSFKPDIVGVSCIFTAKYNDAKNVCRIAKNVFPDCITVMGGAHPTNKPHDVLQDSNLDFVVLGEADYSFLELIQYIEGKIGFDGLDGIGMKIDDKITIIPKKRFIDNLDELPFPARHLLPIDKYWKINLPGGEATRTPWTVISTSRGCPASCIYCSASLMWGKKYRPRSSANVLKEIELLIKDYGIKEVLLYDDNFSLDKKRTEQILDGIIDNKWDLTWATPNGIAVYTLDENLLAKFKKSGCSCITFAVESGSQRVLDEVLKKPVSIKRVEEMAKVARKVGLKTKGLFMLGIPGETKGEMNKTLEMARKLKLGWSCFNVTTPLPGTKLYEICVEKKYVKADIDTANADFSTGKINTEEFDEEYVNSFWKSANTINFLENPNLMEGGDVSLAISDFKRVIRMVPNHELAHFALGNAYAKNGMISDAIKEWKTVLNINKDSKLAKDLLSKYDKNSAR